MSPELEKKLFDKYPKIFAQHKLPMSQTAMCWGIETSDGWYNIIDKLCGLIQGHVDWQRKMRANDIRYNRALRRALTGDKNGLIHYYKFRGEITNHTLEAVEKDIKAEKSKLGSRIRLEKPKLSKVEAVQIKEKFGTLRFYTNTSDRYIDGLISMAESMSSITCETCGKPGHLRGGGWVYAACDEHTTD